MRCDKVLEANCSRENQMVNENTHPANPDKLSLDVILPLFVNKCQKGKRTHMRNYSVGVSSESELKPLDESESEECGMVEAEVGVAA
jgi:hypothetical protein